MSSKSENQIDMTRLMQAAAEVNQQASHDLLPLVYGQLRAIAARRMKLERPDHTLQPTALVHEAFLTFIYHLADEELRTSLACWPINPVFQKSSCEYFNDPNNPNIKE